MSSLDLIISNLRSCMGTRQFFRHGWGHPHTFLPGLLSTLRTTPPSPITPSWQPLSPTPFHLATFLSPCHTFLPPSSHQARFLYLPSAPDSPLALHLPATGEHGFLRRVFTLALWLRRHGVASVILEGPFYGRRKPYNQSGAMLNTVHDLIALGHATIQESAAVLAYFKEKGVQKQAVTGISQGGLHSAMVATVVPWEVGFVAAFAPHSAAPVFTEGVLSKFVNWNALGEGAKEKLVEVLGITDIANFQGRGREGSEMLLLAKDDCYIDCDTAKHWIKARPHIQIEWYPGGHVSGALFHYNCYRHNILQVINRLVNDEQDLHRL